MCVCVVLLQDSCPLQGVDRHGLIRCQVLQECRNQGSKGGGGL